MKTISDKSQIIIKKATKKDVPLILSFINELAEYERLSHEVVATEKLLRETLFGKRIVAESLIAFFDGEPVGFALYFHNFSTFLGRPGIYLEDIYVRPNMRSKGVGRAVLTYLARLAKERECGRFEWAALNWNEPAIKFYKNLGAVPLDEWTTFRLTGEALNNLAK